MVADLTQQLVMPTGNINECKYKRDAGTPVNPHGIWYKACLFPDVRHELIITWGPQRSWISLLLLSCTIMRVL